MHLQVVTAPLEADVQSHAHQQQETALLSTTNFVVPNYVERTPKSNISL